jgi:multimeric flavodoxin WrbA
MQLAIINGSPRYKKSNSHLLTEHFLLGYNSICASQVPIAYLANCRSREKAKEVFQNAEIVLFIFPLYTDCMPGIVKEFIENISELKFQHTKKVGFIVQSGFPESIHSVGLEHYLEKLAKRLKYEYLGTIIKGGVEGIQRKPPWMTKKLFTRFRELGEYFAKNQSFSLVLQEVFKKPYKLSPLGRFAFNTIRKTGLTNFYWNNHLKEFGAFNDRFAKPYAEGTM